MKPNAGHPHRRVLCIALAAGVAAAGVASASAIGAAPSRAECQTSHPCGGGQGTTPTTPTEPGKSGDSHRGGDSSGNRHADPADGILPLTAQAAPVLDRRVTLDGVAGTVLVRTPAGTGFVALAHGASVPVGSTVEATSGSVTLTSVRDASGAVQHGRFWGAEFRVEQTRGPHPTTVLVLVDAPSACSTSHPRVSVTAAGRRVSRLWGRDHHGRFSTRGHSGVASVRGTVWMTQDTCAGTLFRVAEGAIVVRDFHTHRRVRVSAGKSYLARP